MDKSTKTNEYTNMLNRIYEELLKFYGPQGWWPVINRKTGLSEYKSGIKTKDVLMFEIAIGAILTQNVTWENAERALRNLKLNGQMDPLKLNGMTMRKLAKLIKPSGYYNQKSIKITNFLKWLKRYDFSLKSVKKIDQEILRDELLSINGIGPETADSILLYSLSKKSFVIDAYTRRIFSRIGIFKSDVSYDYCRNYFHNNFIGEVNEYNEYHALIVFHGKEICLKGGRSGRMPKCNFCIIRNLCSKKI